MDQETIDAIADDVFRLKVALSRGQPGVVMAASEIKQILLAATPAIIACELKNTRTRHVPHHDFGDGVY